VIGGDNAQGKTCLLDAIEYGLGGASGIPSKPIREGQKKARVVLDLGDIVVTRTFTENGTNLTVKNKDGATFASPQAMLDKLVGELTFDPLEFSRMSSREQTEVLKRLVGLDFSKIETAYKNAFDKRTDVNRTGKKIKAQLDAIPKVDDVPDEEISITELTELYQKSVQHNAELAKLNESLESKTNRLAKLKAEAKAVAAEIKQLKPAIDRLGKSVDVVEIQKQVSEAEETNRKVRQNRERVDISEKVDTLRSQSAALTNKLAELTKTKANRLANAKFPVDGLGIDDSGVTFEGIPFEQCSSAQRIRVSMAMGLAMNPKLRILLIRDGSLLDTKSLAMVAKMAEEADAQIWLERVSKGSECSVIIEDGSVCGTEEKPGV